MTASASRENDEEKRLLKKKKPLSLAFELLNERKREKEKEVIVFTECC